MTMMQGSPGRPGARCSVEGSTSACAICWFLRLSGSFLFGSWLHMSAEFLSHSRKHFFRKRMFFTGSKTDEQCRREDVHRDGFSNRRFDRPASLAGVLHVPGVLGERGILRECHCGQIQKPRADYAASAPNFGDVGQAEVILFVLGKLRLVRVTKDIEALGIGLHDPVLDSVMDHLYEMSRAGRPTIDITILGSAGQFFAPRCPRNVATARRECLEDGIEFLNDFLRTADHHAIAAFQSPNTAAGSDVLMMDGRVREPL